MLRRGQRWARARSHRSCQSHSQGDRSDEPSWGSSVSLSVQSTVLHFTLGSLGEGGGPRVPEYFWRVPSIHVRLTQHWAFLLAAIGTFRVLRPDLSELAACVLMLQRVDFPDPAGLYTAFTSSLAMMVVHRGLPYCHHWECSNCDFRSLAAARDGAVGVTGIHFQIGGYGRGYACPNIVRRFLWARWYCLPLNYLWW